MTRLLQAMAGAEHGGAEAFFERLAIAMAGAGIEQRVLIRKNPHRAQKLRQAGIDVVELPFGGALDLSTRWGFRRAIKEFQPSLVLTWMNRATKFCPSGNFIHVGRLGGYYDLKYYRSCHHLIGNTADIRDWIVAQGRDPASVHHVPNFVDARPAQPLPRAAFSTPETAPLVVALGRLHVNKAFDTLIQALAQVPQAYLWLAGEGPERAKLEHLAQHLGVMPRIRFLGWRDDVAALLASGDLFVCPSRHEPLGNVVIEAWAHGKPVIAAAAQGPCQLIQSGVNGILTPIDDATALARAMSQVLGDPHLAQGLAQQGQTTYQTHYTQDAVVACYLDFFRRIGA